MPYPFVGLSGCNIEAPASGLYVNDLEGINTAKLSELTDAEAPRLNDKFKAIDRTAKPDFFNDLLAAIDFQSIEFGSTKQSIKTVGEVGDDVACEQPEEVGVRIRRNVCDHLTLLHTSEIEFIPCSEYLLTIEVREFGTVKKTIQHKTLSGCVNRVRIDYSSLSDTYDIVLKLCGQEILDSVCNSCSCYHSDYKCHTYECSCFFADPLIKRTGLSILETVNHNGVRVTGACLCDPTALICKYANQLAVPYKYKLGIAILEEAIYNDKLTWFSAGSKDQNIQLLRTWRGFTDVKTGRFVSGKYTQALKNVSKFISKAATHVKSDCIVCTGTQFQPIVY